MHNLIVWVRHLRRIAAFQVSTRTTVLTLMIVGAWVATRHLELPIEDIVGDKVVHAIVFFGFAFLMDLAVSRHPFWLWKGLPLLFYGIGIEILQYFSPDRMFSVLDMVADFAGILLYFVLKVALLWLDSRQMIRL